MKDNYNELVNLAIADNLKPPLNDKKLIKIMDNLKQLRSKTIKQGIIENFEKDDYLANISELAKAIGEVTDVELKKKIDIVVKAIDKSEELLSYDPRQDGYWNNKNPKFVKSLDDLLIQVQKDSFSSIDSKHHVMQAVKYLKVEEKEFEVKEKVYDTILPFYGALPLNVLNNAAKKVGGVFLGASYKAEKIDDNTIFLEGDLENLDDVIKSLKEMGYSKVITRVGSKEVDFVLKKYQGSMENDKIKIDIKEESKIGSLIGGIINSTKPISYPILGDLPLKLRERINEVSKKGGYKFNQHTQEFSNQYLRK